MRVELHGTLTVAEVTRCQYFHVLRRGWPYAAVLTVIPMVSVLAVGALLVAGSGDVQFANTVPIFLFATFWNYIYWVLPYRNARKQFATQSFLHEPVTCAFTADEFSGLGPSASWTLAWSTLKNVRETKSLFLLYHHPSLAVIVPKRFFQSDAEMDQWRELVSSAIAPMKIEKPGFLGRRC